MKIGIVSDMHLGYERFREDAYTQAKRALDLASASCDLILIPGDVFDNRTPSPEVIAEGINIFRELSKRAWQAKVTDYISERETHTSVPVVAISGTHERTAIGRDNALRLLDLAGLLVDTSESTTIISKGEERVAIYGIGGVSEELFKSKIGELAPRPVEGAFNIFMFHQSVYELLPFNEAFVRTEELPKGFDLYIDGHLHTNTETEAHRKPFLIPGSTVITQMKEGEQSSKGFIIFDTKERKHTFVEINSRAFVSKEINVSGKSSTQIKERCAETIAEILRDQHNAIIRLRLKGELNHGISNSEISIKGLIGRYSKEAFIEVDTSKITNASVEEGIREVRENKIHGESIKEQGLATLQQALESLGFTLGIPSSELFEMLVSTELKKERLTEQILEKLDAADEKENKEKG